jgi:hypothetical protein
MSDEAQPEQQPEPQVPKWGDPISEDRHAELQRILNAWNAPDADHSKRKGPFDRWGRSDEERGRLRLTGADVHWLVEHSERSEFGQMPTLHLEEADLLHAQLQGANLNGAKLQGINLDGAQLQGAYLWNAQLQEASLNGAQLQGANLGGWS